MVLSYVCGLAVSQPIKECGLAVNEIAAKAARLKNANNISSKLHYPTKDISCSGWEVRRDWTVYGYW